MKTFAFSLVAFVLSVSAVESQTRPLGRAFLNDPVNSAEEYARVIERCDLPQMKELNLGCDELVRSFNEAFDDVEDVTNFRELAAYVRTLSFRPCPQREVEIARIVDGKVGYFKRELRVGEMCLVDLNRNRVISSAVCGQWVRTKLGLIFTELGASPPPSTPGSVSPSPSAGISVAAKKAAEGTELKRQAVVERERRAWYNPRRRSGAVFWGAAVIGGAAAAYCFIPEQRCAREVTQIVNVH